MEFGAAVEDFLATCRLREMSPGTIRGYRYDLGRIAAFLAGRGIGTVEEITPTHLRAFLSGLRVGASARSRYRASMRSLFHFLAAEGVVAHDPSRAVPAVSRPHYLPHPLAADQVVRVLEAVDDPSLRRLLTLVAETGLRISEAIHLGVEDVRLAETPEASWIRVIGKGRRERVIPLLMATLSFAFLPGLVAGRERGPVFRPAGPDGSPGTQAFSYDAIRPAWQRACRAAGTERIRIHQLRHTFASRLVAAEVPIVTVQKLLGHQSLDTTMRYAAVTDSLVRHDLTAAKGRLRLLAPGGAGPRADAPGP